MRMEDVEPAVLWEISWKQEQKHMQAYSQDVRNDWYPINTSFQSLGNIVNKFILASMNFIVFQIDIGSTNAPS